MTKTLDQKLAAIHADPSGSKDFILADAKDADMGFGRTAPGPRDGAPEQFKSLEDYRDQIREVIRQEIVDIMLLSASNVEKLAIREGLFKQSKVTAAARANDTSDIWIARSGIYTKSPSLPFSTASIEHIKYGKLTDDCRQPASGADLGLYSMTFCNQCENDHATLERFRAFRHECEKKQFRYFLEVFNPNLSTAVPADEVGAFLNDHIIRALAGVTEIGRPIFLKIPFNGPAALEELVSYDPHLIVGVLGGSSGTAMDAFQLLYDAKKYGARAALFGRKINLVESPLAMVELLRKVADGEVAPKEAVKLFHDRLQAEGRRPHRSLDDDLQLTPTPNHYGS
jgi:hypothetical protein